MARTTAKEPRPLVVSLAGETSHAEFAEAMSLLRESAEFVPVGAAAEADLVVLAQVRPGLITTRQVSQIRRVAPLAGLVALLGSWCEGETRTGHPVAGVHRVYWYDFAAWWWRQLALWNSGRCPEWVRPEGVATPQFPFAKGNVVLETICWETTAALIDVLQQHGYASAHTWDAGREAVAGIWEGRQLDECDVVRLEGFCRQLAPAGAPVIALLDFPRVDRCALALEIGASAVVAKPWRNADLLELLQRVIGGSGMRSVKARAA